MTLPDALGYAAAACTTLSFVPQVWRIWRSRSADDISAAMYSLFILGLSLWLVYGLVLRAWPVIVANVVTLALAASILLLKLRFRRSDRDPR